MPYPSPMTYPSPTLYPGFADGTNRRQVSLGGELVLGATDPDGTRWTVNDISGWPGSPGSTLRLTGRARGHGATGSEPYLPERVMTLSGHIHARDTIGLEKAMDRLSAACSLQPTQMLVSEASRVRGCMVQRQGDVIPTPITDVSAHYSVIVVAKDPLKYGDLVSGETLLPHSSGGLVRPSTWPRTWSGVSDNGVIRVFNEGNTASPVWMTVDGPMLAGGWAITHLGQNRSLGLSLVLDEGEHVTIDMDRREVLAQGQAARAGYVTSRGWFRLDPGWNEVAFTASTYSPAARLTLVTQPAWL